MVEKFWQRNTVLKIISVFAAIFMWLYVSGKANPTAETVISVPLETRALASDLVIEDKPATINVRVEGKKQVIETISSRDIRAVADLHNVFLGKNTVPIQVETPQNVDIISVEPSQATIIIDEISDSQFPVTVSFTGRPASGYITLEPVLTPSQVIVAGPRNVLNKIERAYVTVNLNDVSDNILENLPVHVEDKLGNSLMEWVRVIPQTVEVFAPVVEDKPGKLVLVKPVLEGQPAPGYEIKRIIVEPEMVRVYGKMSILRDLKYLDTAGIDISDAQEDVQQQVQLRLPPGVTPSIFTPVQVFVDIGPEEAAEEKTGQ